jgi:alcohol dehydrogenase class IV
MRFEFITATRILFGPGTLREVAPAAGELGRRILIVCGKSPGRVDPLLVSLDAAGLYHCVFPVPGEPTTDLVQAGANQARANGCDLVIAMGGGSPLDAGKAIAALATNPGHVLDYLEVVGKGKPLGQTPLPFIAIPTTAGTGTEVTRNAVLMSPAHRVKASLRSPLLLARLAVVDPELTLGLPPDWTASTGLDALTQLVEPFVSCRANPLVDGLCREGVVRVARSLRRAVAQLDDLAAREDMAVASLFSGLALANAGLGAVHGFAAPIGGSFPAPHGAVCAALLPHVMEMNIRALHRRQPHSAGLARYTEIARLLTGNSAASEEEGVRWVRSLCADLRIPPLRSYGLRQEDVTEVCEKASQASSMKANPLPLTADELREILSSAI